jgi:hypothetical protein
MVHSTVFHCHFRTGFEPSKHQRALLVFRIWDVSRHIHYPNTDGPPNYKHHQWKLNGIAHMSNSRHHTTSNQNTQIFRGGTTRLAFFAVRIGQRGRPTEIRIRSWLDTIETMCAMEHSAPQSTGVDVRNRLNNGKHLPIAQSQRTCQLVHMSAR